MYAVRLDHCMYCFKQVEGGVSFGTTGDEESGKRMRIDFFGKCFGKGFAVFVQIFLGCFVAFRKDDGAFFPIFIEPIDESQIDCLWRDTTIDEDKYLCDVFFQEEVISNHIFPVKTCILRDFGIAVSREIDEISAFGIFFFVFTRDGEIIDELGLPWFYADFRQVFLVTQAIDEG